MALCLHRIGSGTHHCACPPAGAPAAPPVSRLTSATTPTGCSIQRCLLSRSTVTMTAEEVDAYATLHEEQFAAEFNDWARAIWRKLPAAEAYAPPDDFASIYAETPPDVEGAADAAEEERTEARQSQSQSQEDEEEDGPEGGEGTQVSGEAAAELAECDGDADGCGL